MTYELSPIYSNVKSFYSKAIVMEDDNTLTLISYNTMVATIDKTTHEFMYLWCDYSATTARHVNEFLQQNGFCKMSKKEMLSYKA